MRQMPGVADRDAARATPAPPVRDNGRHAAPDRIYTKTGDEGMTGLGGGQRVPKDSQRVETYGTVDELNSQIGVALATGLCERLTTELPLIQNELFDLGSDLATPATSQARHPVPTVEAAPYREARAADRRAQRGRRAAHQLPAAGRIAGCGPAPRRPDHLPPRRARGDRPSPATRRSARRSSPTSTACRTRCSSWPATRTTNAASPNRSGGPAPDVVAARGSRTGSSGRRRRRASKPTEATARRDTIGARPAASATTRPANRPGRPATRSVGRDGRRRTRMPRRRSSAAADRAVRSARPACRWRRRPSAPRRADRDAPVRELAEQVGVAADDPQRQRRPVHGRPRSRHPAAARPAARSRAASGRRPRRRSTR